MKNMQLFLKSEAKRLATWLKENPREFVGISCGVIALLLLIVLAGQKSKPVAVDTRKAATTIDVNSVSATTVGNQTTVDGAGTDTTMKWVKSVSISDNDIAINGTVTEEIDENQVFTGGLSVPKGWTIEYSTSPHGTAKDLRTFAAYDLTNQNNNPLSSITYLRINTNAADTVKPYADSPLVRPFDAKQFITDGKAPSKPILFQNKIYVIIKAMRASTTGSYTLDCFDLITYTRCVNGANSSFFPTYLSTTGASATTPTALGTGTKNISTPGNVQTVMDDGTYGHNGRVYLPAQVGNNYGVACVDLATYQNCGFTSMGSATAPTGTNPSWLSGFVQSGSKIYGHANDNDQANQTVVCFDIRDPGSGGGICSGYTATTTAVTQTQAWYEHGNNYDTPGVHVMDGNKLYWTVNYRYGNTRLFGAIFPWDTFPNTQRDLGTVLTCYDVVARATCSGVYNYNWPRIYDGSGGEVGTEYASTIFMWRQNGANTAVCYTFSNVALNQSNVESRILCHNLTDGSFTTGGVAPAILPVPSVWQGLTVPGSPAWRMSPNNTTITDTDGHERTYFAYQYGSDAARGASGCFDWTTQAHCSGFPWMKYRYNINDAANGDEGYAYDGSCMFGVSKQGFIWSFNATTSESPCRVARTKYTATINTSSFYCDGQSHPVGWKSARLAQASMYDFSSYNVKIYDTQGGTLLGTANVKDIGKLDLTGAAYSGRSSLYVEVDSNVWNPSPWSNNGQPYSSIQASGDDVQYCYNTRAKTYNEDIACNITQLATHSDAVFMSDDNTFTKLKDGVMSFTQNPTRQCFKDIKVQVSTNSPPTIYNGGLITYSLQVTNKANTDPHHRGDIGGQYETKTAQYEATIPTGLQFVSASDGGTESNDHSKVIWANQAVSAADNVVRTVTLRAISTPVSSQQVGSQQAGSPQYPLAMQGNAIYSDDVYQTDNTTTNNEVTFENNLAPTLTDLTQTVASPRDPATLHFTVTATDDVAVSSVALLRDGNIVGTMNPTSTPNQYDITLTNQAGGNHTYTAQATDSGTPAMTGTSSPLSVDVASVNTGPTLTNFTQNTSNPKAPATLVFTVTATDVDGVSSIELLSGETILGAMTASGVANQYTASVSGFAAGSYSFKVRATDAASPALTSTTSDINVTVGTPAPRTPSPSLIPTARPNTPPVISDFVQTATDLKSPAKLVFTVSATDDSAVKTIELLRGDSTIGTMLPTTTPNEYALTLTDYAEGQYDFTVKVTDDGTPPLTTTSASLRIAVAAGPAPDKNSSNGGSGTTAKGSGTTKPQGPLAVLGAVQAFVQDTTKNTLSASDTLVRSVSPGAARAIPYTTIFILFDFALVYVVLAARSVQSRLALKKLVERTKQTEVSRKSFVDITSHYLNTPIFTMQSSIQLFEAQGLLPANVVGQAKLYLQELSTHAHNLLASTQGGIEAAKQSASTPQTAHATPKKSILGFILPITGAFVVLVIVNVVFVSAKKFTLTPASVAIQLGLFTLSATALYLAYSVLKREQVTIAATNRELELEKAIAQARSTFIQSSAAQLSQDVLQIKAVVPNMKAIPKGDTFLNGLSSLDETITKFAYLDTLAADTTSTTLPLPINGPIYSVLDVYKPLITRKKITLAVDIEGEHSAVIDETGLRQIIGSLLKNAVKFTDIGGRIALNVTKHDDTIIIKVEDNGAGIAPKKLDELFKPFSRATDTQAFDYEGIGIDLYLDKLITDHWKGEINISSREKHGTTVTVSLPAKDA